MVGLLRLGADSLQNKQNATSIRRYANERIWLVGKFVKLHHHSFIRLILGHKKRPLQTLRFVAAFWLDRRKAD